MASDVVWVAGFAFGGAAVTATVAAAASIGVTFVQSARARDLQREQWVRDELLESYVGASNMFAGIWNSFPIQDRESEELIPGDVMMAIVAAWDQGVPYYRKLLLIGDADAVKALERLGTFMRSRVIGSGPLAPGAEITISISKSEREFNAASRRDL